MLGLESDARLLALLDSFAMVRISGPPEPPRTPLDEHIEGGLCR